MPFGIVFCFYYLKFFAHSKIVTVSNKKCIISFINGNILHHVVMYIRQNVIFTIPDSISNELKVT